ncbi:DegT/DnrJ/EryC1/StrS family aminotransferase [Arthrobacter sp. NPDC058127]|uniref:DegT/DnrJ/EryC1/StrS family aminotransferase n=1 Tax=Arthrobacter sp. NPDC058127 TaxID=3346351 RepID=UPI0036E36E4A
MSGEQHPDGALLQRSQRAIRAWLEKPASTATSPLTGGGAIARSEARLAELHEGRPALLMPSATYALWVALRTLGIGPGDEVLIPKYDWVSSLAVVRELRATPIPVPVVPATLTIDPVLAAARRTARTRAIIATHLFGIPTDVPELRRVLPGVPIVEDCAAAFGSTLDGRPVGVFGDAAIMGFGPGKRIDVGELGALVLCDDGMRKRALQLSAHPVRQKVSGIAFPELTSMSIRPHPLAAMLLLDALDEDDAGPMIQERLRLANSLLVASGIDVLGLDARRGVASRSVSVLAEQVLTAELPAATKIAYGEVQDIDALARGTSRSRRIVFITTAAQPLGVHRL